MKNNLVELVFVLDRSGSMSGLEEQTISSYNDMIEKQKKDTESKLISMVIRKKLKLIKCARRIIL